MSGTGIAPGPGLLVSLLLIAAGPALATDADRGSAAALYYPCGSCHGAAGEGSEPFGAPPLAGLPREYLARQLRDFQEGRRGAHAADAAGQEMNLLAKSLKGEAAADSVASFIAALPAVARPLATLRGDLRRGRSLYATCAACHGVDARGNAQLMAPPLAQLPDWYLQSQIEAFRRGLRGTDAADIPGQQMRAVVRVLVGERDSTDLATYIVTLP
jgi:cytochrome c oxidase subunit 2